MDETTQAANESGTRSADTKRLRRTIAAPPPRYGADHALLQYISWPDFRPDGIDDAISTLQSRLAGNIKLYRKNAPRRALQYDLQKPSGHGLPLLRYDFKNFAGVIITEQALLELLMSNDVLPLLKLWKEAIFDDPGLSDSMYERIALLGKEGEYDRRRTLSVSVAQYAEQRGVHKRLHREWRIYDFLTKKTLYTLAAFAAKLYKRCETINRATWKQPYMAYLTSLDILVAAWWNLTDEPEGFFATLLASPLADPMQQRIREKWVAKYTLPEGLEEVKTADSADLELIDRYESSLGGTQAASFDSRHIDSFTDQETLALLLAYKDIRSNAQRHLVAQSPEIDDSADDDLWTEIAVVLPGRLPSECHSKFRWLFATNDEINFGKLLKRRRGFSPDNPRAKIARKQAQSPPAPTDDAEHEVEELSFAKSVRLTPEAHGSETALERPPAYSGNDEDTRNEDQANGHSQAALQPQATTAQPLPRNIGVAHVALMHRAMDEASLARGKLTKEIQDRQEEGKCTSQLRADLRAAEAKIEELDETVHDQQAIINRDNDTETLLDSARIRIEELERKAVDRETGHRTEIEQLAQNNGLRVQHLEKALAEQSQKFTQQIEELQSAAVVREKDNRKEQDQLKRAGSHRMKTLERELADQSHRFTKEVEELQAAKDSQQSVADREISSLKDVQCKFEWELMSAAVEVKKRKKKINDLEVLNGEWRRDYEEQEKKLQKVQELAKEREAEVERLKASKARLIESFDEWKAKSDGQKVEIKKWKAESDGRGLVIDQLRQENRALKEKGS